LVVRVGVGVTAKESSRALRPHSCGSAVFLFKLKTAYELLA